MKIRRLVFRFPPNRHVEIQWLIHCIGSDVKIVKRIRRLGSGFFFRRIGARQCGG